MAIDAEHWLKQRETQASFFSADSDLHFKLHVVMQVALLSSILRYLSIYSKVAASIESEMLVWELPPPDEIGLVSEIGTGSFEVTESGVSD